MSHFRIPFRADLRKIIGKNGRRTRTVRAVNDEDLLVRKLLAWVASNNLRIVPILDLTKEDVREDRAGESKSAADTFNIVRNCNGSNDGRQMDHRAFGSALLIGIHRRIAASKVDRTIDQIIDTGTRADTLIINAGPRLLLVIIDPLAHDGSNKGRAGTIHILCEGARCNKCRYSEHYNERCEDMLS